jgi:hypothetical protein
MVSKLLVATQENILLATEAKASDEVLGKLISHYYEIRAGIGINKNPALYGGFPTDPYSHTPGNAGAQQPGMTGQVKEDILNRWAELGLDIDHGQIGFKPKFLQKDELFNEQTTGRFFDINNNENEFQLSANALAFTYCQVPIIYELGDTESIVVKLRDGTEQRIDGTCLSRELSREIFDRSGKVKHVKCFLTSRSFI